MNFGTSIEHGLNDLKMLNLNFPYEKNLNNK